MQHILRNAMTAFALCAAVVATAADSHVRVLGENYQPRRIMDGSTQSSADILIREDFSRLPGGTIESPTELVPFAGERTAYPLDANITDQPGWSGWSVSSIDGAMMMRCPNPQFESMLRTPCGDYSGHVTVTCVVRALKTKWGEDSYATGTELLVIPMANDNESPQTDVTSYGGFFDYRLYPKDGWVELTMTYDNMTSDNRGFIQFNCDTDLLIDEVRITSSSAEFIAPPTMKPLTNITEDSFTINWQPVRKSFNYYIHLFTFEGYDGQGNPVMKRVWPDYYTPEDCEEADEMEANGQSNPYRNNLDMTSDTTYTFTGLNPDKEYYYCVCSHLVLQFSSLDFKHHAMFVARPEQLAATDIDKQNGAYTANWKPVAKADSYQVVNYGVYTMAEDQPDFMLLDEDFSGFEELSDADGLVDMEQVPWGEDSNPLLGEGTQMPGWSATNLGYAKGKAGFWNGWGGDIVTPELWVANADVIRVGVGFEGQYAGQPIGIEFGGQRFSYELQDSIMDAEFEIPTNGCLSSTLRFYSGDGMSTYLLDYITVSQDMPRDANVYVFQERRELEAGKAATTFTDLDFTDYDNYAFQVTAYHNFDKESCQSEYQLPRLVDWTPANVEQTLTDRSKASTAAYYDLMGRRIANPRNGIFVKVQDGKATKVAM